MVKIFKYPIERPSDTFGSFTLEMPKSSVIQSIINQNNTLCVYAEVDAEQLEDKQIRQLYIVGTGKEVPQDVLDDYVFITTVQQEQFVWHIYIKPRI